jgi:hypothetical protein
MWAIGRLKLATLTKLAYQLFAFCFLRYYVTKTHLEFITCLPGFFARQLTVLLGHRPGRHAITLKECGKLAALYQLSSWEAISAMLSFCSAPCKLWR